MFNLYLGVFLIEYRLNKIDTELRQMVEDATREGRVHVYKKPSKLNEYREEEKEQNKNESFKKKLAKYKGKEKIVVDAVMVKKIDIEVSKEEMNLTKGRFLDIKR